MVEVQIKYNNVKLKSMFSTSDKLLTKSPEHPDHLLTQHSPSTSQICRAGVFCSCSFLRVGNPDKRFLTPSCLVGAQECGCETVLEHRRATTEHGPAEEHRDVCGARAKETRKLRLTQRKRKKKEERKRSLTGIHSQSHSSCKSSQTWLSPGLGESEPVPFSCKF